MSSTSKRSPSSIASCRIRGSWAKRTISSAVTERGLTATSMPACSKTSAESGLVDDPDREAERRASSRAPPHRGSSRPPASRTRPRRAVPIRSRSRKSGSIPVAWKTRASGSSSATSRARGPKASITRTLIPCSSRTPAIATPVCAAAEDDDVVENAARRETMIRPHSRAASGEPITMIRSPGGSTRPRAGRSSGRPG